MKTKQIQFYNDRITAVQDDSQNWWVAIKPIVEHLGLDVPTAYARIKNDDFLGGVYGIRHIHDASNRVQEMLCLPFDHIHGWLLTLNSNKVNPETREKLLLYKKECYKVLHDNFMGKTANVVENQKKKFEMFEKVRYIDNQIYFLKEEKKKLLLDMNNLDSDSYTKLELYPQTLMLDFHAD